MNGFGKKLTAVLAPQLLYALGDKDLSLPNISNPFSKNEKSETTENKFQQFDSDETDNVEKVKATESNYVKQLTAKQNSKIKAQTSKRGEIKPEYVALESLREHSKHTELLSALINKKPTQQSGKTFVNNVTNNSSDMSSVIVSANTKEKKSTKEKERTLTEIKEKQNSEDSIRVASIVKFGQNTKGVFNLTKFKEADDLLTAYDPKLRKSQFYPSLLSSIKQIAKNTSSISYSQKESLKRTKTQNLENLTAINDSSEKVSFHVELLRKQMHNDYRDSIDNKMWKGVAKYFNEKIDKRARLRREALDDELLPRLFKRAGAAMLSPIAGSPFAKFFGTKETTLLEGGSRQFKKTNWNEKSELALTTVIPEHLGRIEKALTGKEEMVFDYNVGRMVSISEATRNLKTVESADAINQAKQLKDLRRGWFLGQFGQSDEYLKAKKEIDKNKSKNNFERDRLSRGDTKTTFEINRDAFLDSTALTPKQLMEFNSLETTREQLQFIEIMDKEGIALSVWKELQETKKKSTHVSRFMDLAFKRKTSSELAKERRDSKQEQEEILRKAEKSEDFSADDLGTGDVERLIDPRLDSPEKVTKFIDAVLKSNREDYILNRKAYLFKQMHEFSNKNIKPSDIQRMQDKILQINNDFVEASDKPYTDDSESLIGTLKSSMGFPKKSKMKETKKEEAHNMQLLDCCKNLVSSSEKNEVMLGKIYELINPFFADKTVNKKETMNERTHKEKAEKLDKEFKTQSTKSLITIVTENRAYHKTDEKLQKEANKIDGNFLSYFKRKTRFEMFGKLLSGITGVMGSIGGIISTAIGGVMATLGGIGSALGLTGLAGGALMAGKGLIGKGMSAIGKTKVGATVGKVAGSALNMVKNSKIVKYGLGLGGMAAAKEAGAKAAQSAATKAAASAGVKLGAKTGLKSLIKKIPIIGAIAGLGFGLSRLLDGDIGGAAAEVASGAASIIPGTGTAASIAIDTGLAARDYKNATQIPNMDIPENNNENFLNAKPQVNSNGIVNYSSIAKEDTSAILEKIHSQLKEMGKNESNFHSSFDDFSKKDFNAMIDSTISSVKELGSDISNSTSNFIDENIPSVKKVIPASQNFFSNLANDTYKSTSRIASATSKMILAGANSLREIVNSFTNNPKQNSEFLQRLIEYVGINPDTKIDPSNLGLIERISQGIESIISSNSMASNSNLNNIIPLFNGGNRNYLNSSSDNTQSTSGSITGLTKMEAYLGNTMNY